MTNHRMFLSFSLVSTILILMSLISCAPQFGRVIISKPDEYRHNYEAKEKVILRAIARVFIEKSIGTNVRVDYEKFIIDSDYFYQDDWRTKSTARVRRLNWKECEVVVSFITEKKTEMGWQMRRLLDKEQYEVFFSALELKIYEEMSRVE